MRSSWPSTVREHRVLEHGVAHLRLAETLLLPLDDAEVLVNLWPGARGCTAVVAEVDGQASDTRVETVRWDRGLGERVLLARCGRRFISMPPNGRACVFPAQGVIRTINDDLRWRLPAEWEEVVACVATADSERVFVVGNQLARLHRSGERRVSQHPLELECMGLALSPDDASVVVATNDDCSLRWYDARGLDVAFELQLDAWAYAPSFSPDGASLAVPTDRGLIVVDVAEKQPRFIGSGRAEVGSCAFDPTGQRLASADGALAVHDVATGAVLVSSTFEELSSRFGFDEALLNRGREQLGEPDMDFCPDTEGGYGVGAVTWDAFGLWVAAYAGLVWRFEVCD